VGQALALHPISDTHLDEQIDGARLQNTSANAFLAILAGPALENNGFDAFQIKEVGKDKAGGAGSDDSNLGA